MKLIIQIPCYNEKVTLPQTIAELPHEIEGINAIEYLIINDARKDNTVNIVRACGMVRISILAKEIMNFN